MNAEEGSAQTTVPIPLSPQEVRTLNDWTRSQDSPDAQGTKIKSPPISAKSVEEAITRVEKQLHFIPTATLRRFRVLSLLIEMTNSSRVYLQLVDDIGRFQGGYIWPLPSPSFFLKFSELGPAFAALDVCNEIHEMHWDESPLKAFTLPDSLYLPSLIHRFVYGPLGSRHVAIFGYPRRSDGSHLLVVPVRGKTSETYSKTELGIVERICSHFAALLSACEPFGQHHPRHPLADEHSTELDLYLRPQKTSLHVQALLALFYGEPRNSLDGGVLLPAKLEQEILHYREAYLRPLQKVEGDSLHAFTRRTRGRVLCLSVQSRADGTSRLSLQEDQSQHERLRRMKAACRELLRDRTSVFSVCLILAEGVRDEREIMRRAHLGALKASSARRIINRARRIVEAT